jgi:hypothetical protein
VLEAIREEGTTEELRWVLVLVGPFTAMDLSKISGKLRLLVATRCHIWMRRHNCAPRLEAAGGLPFDGSSRGSFLLLAGLLLKADS